MALQQLKTIEYELYLLMECLRYAAACSPGLQAQCCKSPVALQSGDGCHSGCLLGRPGSRGNWRGVALIFPTTTAVRGAPAEKESTAAIFLMRPPSWPMAFLAAPTSSCNTQTPLMTHWAGLGSPLSGSNFSCPCASSKTGSGHADLSPPWKACRRKTHRGLLIYSDRACNIM